MSKAIFGKYFHICKANTNTENTTIFSLQFVVVTLEMGC